MDKYDFDDKYFEQAWNSPYPTLPNDEVDQSWKNFEKRIKHPNRKFGFRKHSKVAVAASLLVGLVMSYLFQNIYNPTETISNYSQVEKEVILPDGSMVVLKQNSKISYKRTFKEARNVNLEGVAFFDVVSDSLKQFKVETKFSTTVALGTSFLITEKPESKDTEVALFTGRVLVSVEGSENSWALIEGEKFKYENGKFSVEQINRNFSFEKGGAFIDINKAGLKDIFELLEERYGYRIINRNLDTMEKVTLRISRNDTLLEILDLLSIINNLDYVVNDETREIEVLRK